MTVVPEQSDPRVVDQVRTQAQAYLEYEQARRALDTALNKLKAAEQRRSFQTVHLTVVIGDTAVTSFCEVGSGGEWTYVASKVIG